MTPEELTALEYDWKFWARPSQIAPEWSWFGWLLLSGRGFGKTKTGAEQVREWVGGITDPPIQIALVGETAADARDVMVGGESGILSCSPPWNMPTYETSKRRVTWPNGSIAITFSGEEPDQLRGPQFHKAWVDELAKYRYPQETWDNLEFGLRLGDHPQVVVTTTPRPIPIIKEMLVDPMFTVTRGSSYENMANLAATYIQRVLKKYEGTRIGRQELHAEVLDDMPGALWNYTLLDINRVTRAPEMKRIVVAIDPATTSNEDSDETGIVVAGLGTDERGYLLRDASGVYSPDGWAQVAIALYGEFSADRIVAEVNQGGDMVERIIRTRAPRISYRSVRAARSKQARAEPVAALMEQGNIKHVGRFAKLEDQMVVTTPEGYLGGGSPDRMDAMVWAFTDLMFGTKVSTNPDDYRVYRR